MKINRSIPIRKWIILILSVRLVPIVQTTYLDSYQANYQNYNHQNSPSNLTSLESIQDETYVQNRDQVFLNHLNQLNYDGRNLFNYGNINRQYKRAQQPSHHQNSTDEHLVGKSNVLTKRIALSTLANIFGGNSDEEEKKVEKPTDNQTEKSAPIRKENATVIEDLNKNVTTGGSQEGNQSALLKNHLQNDRDIEALNRLINFSKNYENWSDHLKNPPYNLNHHRQDLINLLGLNDTNLSDSSSPNGTDPQDPTVSKNKFAFSPEYASKTLFENSHFGFRPNNFLSSLLANSNNEHEYMAPRFNKLASSLSPTEAMTEASDQNVSEYEDANRDEYDEGQPAKLIDNRNESAVHGKIGERRRKVFRNPQQRDRMRPNGQRLRQRAKIRKTYDNNNNYPYNKNIAQSGFRPIDNKLLKEQSQISASTGVKRNPLNRNYKSKTLAELSPVDAAQQPNDNNSNSQRKRGNQSASSFEQEYNQLSVSNQPYSLRQPNYRFPSNLYGKRLVNEIMNSQPNVRKTLVSTTSNKNSVVNNESASDHLDEENNEAGKEETLNEQDKQLVTDKTKEFYEKNEEDLNDLPVDEPDNNREIDRGTSNEPASNHPPQLSHHQTHQQQQQQQSGHQQQHQAMNNQQVDTQLNQPILANQLSNQPEIETNENDSAENENESLNSTATPTKESDNQEATGKSKLTISDLNKSAKQDKNSLKSKSNSKNKMNWKSFYQNYKHHDIYDKYSKLGKNNFNFDQDIPSMSAYLSNENFKINLSGKSELDDDLASFPYPNVQYNGKPTASFGSHYYPLLKKKPYFGTSYPYPGFSSNPLNGMLFDKLSMPVVDSYAIEKLPGPSLANTIKGVLDKPSSLDNKFYNLENKLHHLNSKYSLNSLSPPPYPLPPHLESTKYYEPKTHHDSKYHNLNHWTSPMITGFLLGVVPFSFLLASMAPTISAITSGSAAAAALGRRRRSVDGGELVRENETIHSISTDLKRTKFDENVICLSKLSKIIASLNELGKEGAKQDQAKVYFNELIDLQKKCEFNFKFPTNLFQEMRNILNLSELKARDEKTLKRLKDSYFSYNLGNSKMSLLDTILNFIFSLDLIKDRTSPPNQFRSNQTGMFFQDVFSAQPPFLNFFHLREGKCVQEIICKLISNPKFEKGVFSNFISLLVSMIPNNLANKYGLDVLVFGLKASKCTPGPTFC